MQPHAELNLGYFGSACLGVFAMQQKLKGKLCIRVGGLDVPTSIVAANNLVVSLERQLADSASIDAVLRTFIVLLHPVMKNAVVDFKASFFPHDRALPKIS